MPEDRERAVGLLRRHERLRRLHAHFLLVRAALRQFAPAILGAAAFVLPIPVFMAFRYPGAWAGVVANCALLSVPTLFFVVRPRFMLDHRGWAAAHGEYVGRERRRVPRVELVDPEVDAAAARVRHHGTARGEETLRSPLSDRPCLGWRLVGTGPAGRIDEAALGDFELFAEVGSVRVAGGKATLDIAAPGSPHVVTAPGVRALLDACFALGGQGEVRVAEAVLRSGVSVTVEGSLAEELSPEGYRGQRAVLVLRDAPGSPLVVSDR